MNITAGLSSQEDTGSCVGSASQGIRARYQRAETLCGLLPVVARRNSGRADASGCIPGCGLCQPTPGGERLDHFRCQVPVAGGAADGTGQRGDPVRKHDGGQVRVSRVSGAERP